MKIAIFSMMPEDDGAVIWFDRDMFGCDVFGTEQLAYNLRHLYAWNGTVEDADGPAVGVSWWGEQP